MAACVEAVGRVHWARTGEIASLEQVKTPHGLVTTMASTDSLLSGDRLCSRIKTQSSPQIKWCTKDLDLISTDSLNARCLSGNLLHSLLQYHCWKKADIVWRFNHVDIFLIMDTPQKIYIRATPSTNWCKLFSWPLRPLTCIKGYYHKHQPHGTWRKRMATEGWNDGHWLIVAFNDQPYRFLEVFHIIHIWKMICISRLGWQGDCCSHELKTQWLHFDWFISFNILLTISLLSIIFPSDLTLWYH